MTLWYEGPLTAFDAETTGTDVEEDRIISASIVVQDTAGGRPRVTRWLVHPGVPVPPEATAAHGLTEERLRCHGRWPAPVMEEVGRALAEQCAAARPLVVLNAPFALTVLDRELRRHRAASLARYLENVSLCVLDPWVLDRHLDRYRKGSRTLADLCEQYEVEQAGERDGAADALAALEVTRAVGRRFAARMERLSAAELHTLQAVWHAAQARGLQTWFARGGTAEPVDPAWPLRPELRAAA
ncbi:3'-5' exonuclease [Streptomyces amakusaensis]|uniref:Exonuclease domain-containing protein n=1 Tax=Streptomyces amakusaensis TaxID=67271 RepID=A0ABW0APV8_9ACTN